ncbi:MAG: nucleotide exchange factor GrpE [Magnetococcales bacterium]|nr:nucleotide exchange factor GrpE [Magnetococcales bacterium]
MTDETETEVAQSSATAAEVGADSSQDEAKSDEQVMQERIAQLEDSLQEQRDNHLRAVADMDNLRKRLMRDMEQARKFAIEGFARDLLSVLDNLERALDIMRTTDDGEVPSGNSRSLLEGVELTRTEMVKAFNRHGITRIEAMDKPFDPNLHQAMMHVEDDGVTPGTVVQELMAGYRLNERLLRPSMVGVSRAVSPSQSVES